MRLYSTLLLAFTHDEKILDSADMYASPKIDLSSVTAKDQAVKLIESRLMNLLAAGTAKHMEIIIAKGVKGKFLRPSITEYFKMCVFALAVVRVSTNFCLISLNLAVQESARTKGVALGVILPTVET